MKHAKPSKVYRTILIVEGSGDFPIDMLRYDACCPDKEEDSFSITQQKVHPEARAGHRQVKLRRFSVNGLPANVDRWRSRGWDVVSEEPVP